MQVKKPKVYMLMVGSFKTPAEWKWKHPRRNLVILALDPARYVAATLRGEKPIIYDPFRPSEWIEYIYWARVGVPTRGRWRPRERGRRRLERKWMLYAPHPQFKSALREARNICRGLEQAGHIVLWDAYRLAEATEESK